MGLWILGLVGLAWGGERAPASVVSESVRSGPIRERVLPADGADLVVFYTSEHRGQLGPCGCDGSSRGGLPRLHGYLDEARRVDSDTAQVVVHAGSWADDALGQDGRLSGMAHARGVAVSDALQRAGFDVLNGSWRDNLFLEDADSAVPVVTASRTDDRAPSAVVLERGGLSVAVVGVSGMGSKVLLPEDARWLEPVPAIREALGTLQGDPDLVLVLASDTGAATRDIARMPEIDVVVESGAFVAQDEPWFQDGTVWVRSRDEGARIGELRLYLAPDHRIVGVRDRWIDLDGRVPESREQLRLQRSAERRLLKAASAAP